jgi:hypothetical protein
VALLLIGRRIFLAAAEQTYVYLFVHTIEPAIQDLSSTQSSVTENFYSILCLKYGISTEPIRPFSIANVREAVELNCDEVDGFA